MIVCIEGCIGVGKTTLARKLAEELGGQSIFEEYENNPFLKDFYDQPDLFAFHMQTTFLCLQSKQFLKVAELSKDQHVFVDFHPVKSKIFSQLVIKHEKDLGIIHSIYDRLFPVEHADILIVYLQAKPAIIMDRIKQRNDRFTAGIPVDYIENTTAQYSRFFKNYTGRLLTIDTNDLDFEKNPNDWALIKQQIAAQLTPSPDS